MKNRNFRSAFSLMEMMVVLLIVAIIAAATAPMVTKKMARSVGSGDSPWVFTGLNNNIAYNMGGENASAIIGASNYSHGDNQPSFPRLVLAAGDSDHPSLVFARANGAFGGQINMDADNKIVTMNDQTVGNNSVALGFDHTITDAPRGMVVIGQNINAQSDGTVAVGRNITASGGSSVAVGPSTTSTAEGAVAIGRSARAKAKNAISIGSSAGTQTKNGEETGSKSISIGTLTIAAGSSSIAIGDQAQATGQHSLAIGPTNKKGKYAAATDEYSVAIGAGAETSASHQIVLGTDVDTVYVPGNLVVGRTALLNIQTDAKTIVRRANGGHELCLIRSGDLDGGDDNLRKYPTDASDNAKEVYTQYVSDRRLKNVGEKYTAGLEELKNLDFYHYTFKADKDNTPLVGVMAQDLQKVFPDAVTKGDDGYLRIRLEDMFYAVINAVKELDTKVSQLVADVTGISSKVDEQQKVIEAQQQKIDELEKANADFEKRLAKLEKKNKKFEE